METASARWRLNRVDVRKILVGALIAGLGAALTYITDALSEIDFGATAPAVMWAWSVVVNAVRKLILGTNHI